MGACSGRPSKRLRAPARLSRLSVISVTLGVLSMTMACTSVGSGSGAIGPTATSATASAPAPVTASPVASDQGSPVVVAPGDEVNLIAGSSASVEGTDVALTLLEASGPEAGCNDCPNRVGLEVTCPAGPVELEFAFSGGMEPAAMERARRGAACGLEFYIVKVNEGSATVRVLSPG